MSEPGGAAPVAGTGQRCTHAPVLCPRPTGLLPPPRLFQQPPPHLFNSQRPQFYLLLICDCSIRGCRQNNDKVVDCWKWGECGRWGYDGSAGWPAPRYDRGRLGAVEAAFARGRGQERPTGLRTTGGSSTPCAGFCAPCAFQLFRPFQPPDIPLDSTGPPGQAGGLKASAAGGIRGEWAGLLEAVIDDPDFEWLMIDASYIKAHPHSAGARGGSQAIARTKGG